MKLANGVAMLELTAEAFGSRVVINPTLIWDAETAILIDSGMPGQWGQIRAAMQEHGVSVEQLKAVILTHQDLDHIGSMPEILAETNGRVDVYAHELDRPYIEGDLPLIKTTPSAMRQVLQMLPEAERQNMLAMCEHPPMAKVDRTLADGEELPFCGGIRVIHTPGHTEGHISLYLKQSKTLVAADALICMQGKLHGPVPQTTLDMDTATQSLKKFLDDDIESVICYHGGLCQENVKEQLQALAGQMV